MYNGIGLATPRGSGTNGHVQRNWALVKPREKEKNYKTESELAVLDTAANKQPNKEILDHERKRKIELKCTEFADILEEQGYSEEAIKNKVNNYRNMLMGHDGKLEKTVDQWGRVCVTETHQVAEAQQEKNARLREAFGISEYFVDGSSFDPDRQAKEQLAKQEKEKERALEREKEKEQEKQQAARYELVHTPSPEPQSNGNDKDKKKKKRKMSSSSEEHKKKKKSKKRKKEKPTGNGIVLARLI
ncbi:SRRM2 protein homolog rsr-2 isoform X5 [Onthophagus taurus]|uniref:SRRM2 protein homolog rsr-2 isoform X5 n=1 Tax=Onthophagus taurus TaxID=166361 RepID=UPI0039BDA613